ncbi:MAG: OmpH family outer membrane protein [Bryobacteraceae bacterium]
MKHTAICVPALALGVSMLMGTPATAQSTTPPSKVGIIHIQNALLSTSDGKKALNELQAKFNPKKAALEKLQTEIQGLRDTLSKGSNTMAEEMKQKLMRDIDQKTKEINRDTEDAQADLDQEQGRIMQNLGQKMIAVIDKYAKDNSYSLILDVSSQQTPVLYAANGIDITNEVVALYDKNAVPPAAAAAAPSGTAAPRPAATPPAKQQPGTPK